MSAFDERLRLTKRLSVLQEQKRSLEQDVSKASEQVDRVSWGIVLLVYLVFGFATGGLGFLVGLVFFWLWVMLFGLTSIGLGFLSPSKQEREEKLRQMEMDVRQVEDDLKAQVAACENVAAQHNRAIHAYLNAEVTKVGRLEDYSPQDFEDLVAALYGRMGYSVRQTPYRNDGGKDAILTKGSEKTFLECKHYDKERSIGRPVLQRLKGAMTGERVSRGILVTSARFSQPARDFAGKNDIELVDRDGLMALLEQHDLLRRNPGFRTYSIMCTTCGTLLTFPFRLRLEAQTCTCGARVSNGVLLPPTAFTA